MRCVCHGKEHRERNLTALRPSERYPDIDPLPETPGTWIPVCAAWMAERERQRQAQEKRRARKGTEASDGHKKNDNSDSQSLAGAGDGAPQA